MQARTLAVRGVRPDGLLIVAAVAGGAPFTYPKALLLLPRGGIPSLKELQKQLPA
jgi:hypothetical protein